MSADMDIYLSASPFAGPADGLDQAAAAARQAGCTGLEVPATLLAQAATSCPGGIPVRVVGVAWRPDAAGHLAAALELARQMGAWAVNIYATVTAPAAVDAARRALIVEVTAALEKSPAGGPIFLLENELARGPGFAACFSAWAGLLNEVRSPRFRGTLDAANFVAAGDRGAVDRVVAEAAALIAHVHAKGVVPFDQELFARESFRCRWLAAGEWLAAPAGEGDPDWSRLLPALRTAGYEGAVTAEPFREPAMIARAVQTVRQADGSRGSRPG